MEEIVLLLISKKLKKKKKTKKTQKRKIQWTIVHLYVHLDNLYSIVLTLELEIKPQWQNICEHTINSQQTFITLISLHIHNTVLCSVISLIMYNPDVTLEHLVWPFFSWLRGRHGRCRMVVEFTTTCATSIYHD